jgi:4'-phosphopantetheinyl transferase
MVPHFGLLYQVLAADEKERANRFCFEKDINQYVVARGVLRMILSRYLSVLPEELQFRYGLFGKPALSLRQGCGEINFNLSHSRDLVLLGITRKARVGVDIEYISSFPESEEVMEQVLGAREAASQRAIVPEREAQMFFRQWTQREAYGKARGAGLALASERFEMDASESADLTQEGGAPENGFGWSFFELSPMPGYLASLVVEGKGRSLCCWRWEESNLFTADVGSQEYVK